MENRLSIAALAALQSTMRIKVRSRRPTKDAPPPESQRRTQAEAVAKRLRRANKRIAESGT